MAYSDDIATAPAIAIGGTDGGWDNLTATDNAGEPLSVDGSNLNVWQKAWLPSPGLYYFGHDTAAGGDTVMSIYQGPASATYADLVLVGTGDDDDGAKPKVAYTSPGGEWIYIESTGYGGAQYSGQTTFILAVGAFGGWVDTTGAPSYFHAFAADMGPYIGPWPLLPPGVIDGLPAGDEVDFYVALPNPTDPTDVTIVADGSYDTGIWDSWRYANTGTPPPDTFFGYSGDSTGPSAPFPVPTTMPTGAHLYVAAFTPSAPANPPEFYVPASYAAGGVAAFETSMGHWSGDQAGFSQTDSISASSGPTIYTHPTDHTYSGDHDLVAAVSAQITEILAATPTVGSSSIGVDARKTHTTIPAVFETRVQLTANIHVVTYDGTPTVDSDFPPALLALVEDQDWSPTPYIQPNGNAGDGWQYDSPPTWAWQSGAADGFLYEDYDENVSTGESLPFGITLRAQWVAGTIAGTPPWTVSGGSLGDIVGPAVLGSVYSVDYSPVTDLHFTLHAVETFLYTGAIAGLADMAMVSGNREFNDGSLFGPSTPDLAIDRSTWQYWVPGDIVPSGSIKWHTVGGHWATVGGATMRILTPLPGGSVWVDVVDGPA